MEQEPKARLRRHGVPAQRSRKVIPLQSRCFAKEPLACAPLLQPGGSPHFFEIVKGANLGPEDMNDYIARIDQDPIAMGHALHPRIAQTGSDEILEHTIGDRAHMAVRSAGGHNHGIRDRGFEGEIDSHGVLGLHIIEAQEDQAKNFLGGRAQRGDGFGGAASTWPSGCGCWQGSFPFESIIAPSEAGATLT